MKKILTAIVLFVSLSTFCQVNSERILYIIDSIPAYNGFNKVEGQDISEEDIYSAEIVSDKHSLYKYKKFDVSEIIYIITNEYIKRPDSLKSIPTMKQMERLNNRWYLMNSENPYSGKYIDYYWNGIKQGEGEMFLGKLEGTQERYYKNGTIYKEISYENGFYINVEITYYKSGNIESIHESENGKLHGKWESYYPNGYIKQKAVFKNGTINGALIFYSSKGKINQETIFKNGKQLENNTKISSLYKEGRNLYHIKHYKGSLKRFDKIIKKDSLNAQAYLERAKTKIKLQDLIGAKQDLDKAILLEIYLLDAYKERAFLMIEQHGDLELQISNICNDLQFFESYANYNNIDVKKAIKEHCN